MGERERERERGGERDNSPSTVPIFGSFSSDQNAGLLSADELSNVGSGSGHGLPSGLAGSHGYDLSNQALPALLTYSEAVMLGFGGDSFASNFGNQSRTHSIIPQGDLHDGASPTVKLVSDHSSSQHGSSPTYMPSSLTVQPTQPVQGGLEGAALPLVENDDVSPLATNVAHDVAVNEPVADPNSGRPILAEDDDNSNMSASALTSPLEIIDKEEDDVDIFFNFDHEDEAQLPFDSTKKRRLEEGDEHSIHDCSSKTVASPLPRLLHQLMEDVKFKQF
ncbi:hypothetical protein Cgig2_013286 [Carnegiea gigantea]|uniref:Uncharacterized protein n=1 Tax=Carnegiea gigantea TaxID=171969 RepID=A0A9Q1K3P9_9CARY|nr:hypothetical protein Cgig2_013286 [Carnegiea gigantea]